MESVTIANSLCPACRKGKLVKTLRGIACQLCEYFRFRGALLLLLLTFTLAACGSSSAMVDQTADAWSDLVADLGGQTDLAGAIAGDMAIAPASQDLAEASQDMPPASQDVAPACYAPQHGCSSSAQCCSTACTSQGVTQLCCQPNIGSSCGSNAECCQQSPQGAMACYLSKCCIEGSDPCPNPAHSHDWRNCGAGKVYSNACS